MDLDKIELELFKEKTVNLQYEKTLLEEKIKYLEQRREEMYDDFLRWRCIEPGEQCPSCNGSGYKTYGSTSTFRGGFSGQMITSDVCDKCWGSGSQLNKWPDWRKYAK